MTSGANIAGPVRTCCGCGKRDAQSVLRRIRRASDGAFVVAGRQGDGRSAYVHASRECIAGLARSKVLGKSLRANLAAEVRKTLAGTLERELGLEPRTDEARVRRESSDSAVGLVAHRFTTQESGRRN